MTSAAAANRTLCVGRADPCYRTIQAALRAASNGDTIRIASGRWEGGVRVTKSVHIVGSGATKTVILGGGPVLTIGTFNAATQPTVSIDGVTITGGVTHSSGESMLFFGKDGVFADGGGVYVPFGAGFTPGATVTISNSVITGNRAATTETVPSNNATCPTGPCPFASSRGGGIANFGAMTLNDTVVSANAAVGVASDAVGGGIFSAFGDLTLNHTVVSHNRATATVPNGRFAEGGGLFMESGDRISVRDSRINDNVAALRSALPAKAGGEVIGLAANGGGAHIDGSVANTFVAHTLIRRNVARAQDLNGEPLAFDAGMLVGGGRLVMRHSVVSSNRNVVTAKTSVDVGGGGSALELDGAGSIRYTRITNNPSIARSPHGVAQVSGGLAVLNFDGEPQPVVVRHSVIRGNTARAVTRTGLAAAYGGGVLNNSLLRLNGVLVSDNTGRAVGPHAVAQGGGIWNGVLYSGPPVKLSLNNTRIVGNSLTGSPEARRQGGGLYTTTPVNRFNTQISSNTPDQCFGCTHTTPELQTRTDDYDGQARPTSRHLGLD